MAGKPEATGRSRWRHLGLISSLAPAEFCNSVEFDGLVVARKGWGLSKAARPPSQAATMRGLSILPFSLHLLGWKLGSWPVRLLGAQSDMSFGRLINYLLSFAMRLPLERGPPPSVSSRDSDA